MLLIFAIGFGGYSAAAHAYGDDCMGVSQVQAEFSVGDICADSQNGTKKKADNDTSSGDHHCCSAHIAFSAPMFFDFSVPPVVMATFYTDDLTDDLISSLRRPPKSLI